MIPFIELPHLLFFNWGGSGGVCGVDAKALGPLLELFLIKGRKEVS